MDWKKIIRAARRASESEVRELYFEVFGALFSGMVTAERARASIEEACKEMLERGKVQAKQDPTQGEEIMAKQEITNEMILNEIREMSAALTQKIMDLDATVNVLARKLMGSEAPAEEKPAPKKTKAKAETFVPETQADGTKKLVEQKAEVPTIETLREVATKYSAAFGMNDLVSLFKKIGGVAKLSEVADENKALLLKEMNERLSKEDGKKALLCGCVGKCKGHEMPAVVTLEDVKPKAKAFLEKNGKEALGALIKAFGGTAKLSEIPAEKLAAFAEALDNA